MNEVAQMFTGDTLMYDHLAHTGEYLTMDEIFSFLIVRNSGTYVLLVCVLSKLLA